MKKKIMDFMAVFLIQLVLTLPFYIADANALTVSNVKVTKIASNSATVEWDTDASSNSKVNYGKTDALGFNQKQDDFLQKHSVTVFNGINSETTYYFSVQSTDSNGVTQVNNNSDKFYTFRTADITPPSQVTGLKILSATSNSIFISWTNLTAVPDLHHYTVYRDRVAMANSTTNSFNDTSLQPGKSYNYKVSAVDTSGNEGIQSDTLIAATGSFDSTAPEVSNIDITTPSDATARIKWFTNENSTSTVLYGINLTDKIKSSNDLQTNHSVLIDGLLKGTVYTFSVKSCDSSNNCASSKNQTFNAGTDTTPPFINVSIPRYINRRVIDVTGTTEPFSSVALYANDMNIPKRSLSGSEIGSSGKFSFAQIQLDQNNIIKLSISDKAGNKNEKIFEVGVDIEEPAVQLNNVTSITSKLNVTISGTVSKPVTVKVFVDKNVNDSAIPDKVRNLNSTKIGQNSIEFHWDESKDSKFSYYIVYRDDVGVIAVTKPSNYNLYIDALVDSGKTYTYEVSQVNIYGKEGQKSEPVAATTLAGGSVSNAKPDAIDVSDTSSSPSLVLNASNNFEFGVKLDKGDSIYRIRMIFEDKAQNSVVIEKKVILDTKKPAVTILSPPSGAFIYENVAHQVNVVGKTKPNARVHLFIDRTPFSSFDISAEITGFPNEVQNIPQARLDIELRDLPDKIVNISEKDLDAECKLGGIISACRSGADKSVTADSQGNFKFENVDLSASIAGAFRVTEVPVTEIRDVQLNQNANQARKTTLVVIATDINGLRGVSSESISIGNCWSGNQSWDVIPIQQAQYPILISTSRLAEGGETISFIFNYSYIGRGTNAKIVNVGIAKACSSNELSDSRFNISCKILPSGNSPIQLNKPYNTLSYSAIPLNRLPNMDKFVESDWKSFLKAINNEMTFPLKLTIVYNHDILDETGQTKTIKEVQTTCQQVSYVVDSSLLDPRKVLPDWLLYDFVDYLQSSTKALTKAQEQIDRIVDYVAIGCLFSYFAHTVFGIYRNWVEISNEKGFNLKGFVFSTGIAQSDVDCDVIKKSIEGIYGIGNARLKYYSDPDLKKCFPSVYGAWQTEAKFYQLERWSCDRIFGHAAPSRWTETVKDEDLLNRVNSQATCEKDQSVQGQPLKADQCIKFGNEYPAAKELGLDKRCVLVQTDKNKKGLFQIGPLVSGSESLYELKLVDKLTSESKYAIKDRRNDDYFITERTQSCNDVCGVKSSSSSQKHTIVPKSQSTSSQQSTSKPVAEISGLCTTSEKCRDIAAEPTQKVIIDGFEKTIVSAYAKGYTNDCFYEPGKDVSVVSDTSPATREECCCINSKGAVPEFYYLPEDKTRYGDGSYAHESKSISDSKTGPQPKAIPNKEGQEEKFSDMKWSYRYSKIKYEAKGTDVQGNSGIHNKYNPNRYIDGRDLPACFGQDNLFYQALGRKEEILVVNPFKQHTAALQCAHLTGINQRLKLFSNIMGAVSSCLIEVRKNGNADAGVCKELFTQHVCGLIWQVVNLFQGGCDTNNFGVNSDVLEEGLADKIKLGFKGISQGISQTQQEFNDEYGNAKLSNLLGVGEGGVARKVCLAAFGYDWDLTARNLVDAAYTTPFATLVQAVTRSREFLTVDPVTRKPRYEYRASWIINPGCDLDNYNIQLACVSRKEAAEYPNAINCGAVGGSSLANAISTGTSSIYNNCDCLELSQEQLFGFYSGTRVPQNKLIDLDRHLVPDSNFRFDHLKFTLRTDRKIPANIQANCFPTGFDKGVFYFPLIDKTARDIADCSVNPLSGQFSCGSSINFFNPKGTIQLVETTINSVKAEDNKNLKIGNPLDVGLKVIKTGKDKCVKISMTPDVIDPIYSGISLDGFSELPAIRVTDSLRISGRIANVLAPGIAYTLLAQPQESITISVSFIDNQENSKKEYLGIYSDDDKITIDGILLESQKDANGVTNLVSKEYANGKTKIKVESLPLIASNRVINSKITVEQNGAKIEINNVAYTTSVQGGIPQMTGVIQINPPQQGSQNQPQQKTLLIEIFNIKDNSDSYLSPDDCSLNEKVYDKSYSFVVGDKGVDASQLEPVIQNPVLEPQSQALVGSPIKVSVKITQASGIKQGGAIAVLSAPVLLNPISQTMQKEGDTYSAIFSTGSMQPSDDYAITISAESDNGKKSTRTVTYKLKKQT